MPIVDKYKDMGTVVMGKVEAGEAKKGQSLLVMPNRVRIHFLFLELIYIILNLNYILRWRKMLLSVKFSSKIFKVS